MKVLLTGFEPFGRASINPSLEVLEHCASPDIQTLVLPVVYDRAVAIALDAIDCIEPDVVVCLGQAEGRAEISIERVAINLVDAALPDNEGAIRRDTPIVDGGPAAYFSSLPTREMLAAIESAGVPARLSLTAGSFLCNQLFYSLRHGRGSLASGFIHLPLLPEQSTDFPGLPTLSLEQQVVGLRAALGVLA